MYALKGTWFEARRREPKKPPFKFLVPIIYAPILPLIRISLKKQPILRDRVFGVVLAAALIHGGYLVSDLYDQESK
ncbi:uncharacterized protein [Physcomitrium patens]|uniref:Uncharacterized protein n=1 Tax=Physcomitrium patens TaxID=3218 RepID=A0A2K1JTS3_PHYPA|nr:uncharacterized protein LOC112288339 isoform X2 [Physcomitrium patens]PNR44906.1 hypothetical protein PHYPA_014676 [Physcomitrium patens]|eukprot:XP_024388214.1 uncharacterized protein LOC112288339 isoform X2 [Physcomitrella patens]